MYSILGYTEVAIFSFLSGIHFYWALGGTWSLEQALPVNEAGEKVLNPSKKDTMVVGIGLLFFAIFYLSKVGAIAMDLPGFMDYAGWLISVIFIVRAIGDFKYVGFFKKLKHTAFGKRDTSVYAPLCLAIGLIGLTLEVI